MGLADRLRELADEAEAMEARLMPEGMEWLVDVWPRFEDGEPVRFLDDFERYGEENGVSAVTMYADGSFTLNCHAYSKGERVKRPAVFAADGEPLEAGQTVWRDDGERLEVLYLRPDGLVDCCGEIERPERLTHERPESWERLEHDAEKTVCEYFGANYDCAN